ncbi:hypothetical protein EJ07DRAFT_151414 [Lizonia empirigonia]|nr:hypothetical protein EJ07DRAFT_151414 [Lizonia empirigonia]
MPQYGVRSEKPSPFALLTSMEPPTHLEKSKLSVHHACRSISRSTSSLCTFSFASRVCADSHTTLRTAGVDVVKLTASHLVYLPLITTASILGVILSVSDLTSADGTSCELQSEAVRTVAWPSTLWLR